MHAQTTWTPSLQAAGRQAGSGIWPLGVRAQSMAGSWPRGRAENKRRSAATAMNGSGCKVVWGGTSTGQRRRTGAQYHYAGLAAAAACRLVVSRQPGGGLGAALREHRRGKGVGSSPGSLGLECRQRQRCRCRRRQLQRLGLTCWLEGASTSATALHCSWCFLAARGSRRGAATRRGGRAATNPPCLQCCNRWLVKAAMAALRCWDRAQSLLLTIGVTEGRLSLPGR